MAHVDRRDPGLCARLLVMRKRERPPGADEADSVRLDLRRGVVCIRTRVARRDGDGQHSAGDAVRLVERLGDYDLVIGARTSATQASLARRAGNATLNGFASYLTGTDIRDLTSGFRAARRDHLLEFIHLLPNGFSTPTTTTLAPAWKMPWPGCARACGPCCGSARPGST